MTLTHSDWITIAFSIVSMLFGFLVSLGVAWYQQKSEMSSIEKSLTAISVGMNQLKGIQESTNYGSMLSDIRNVQNAVDGIDLAGMRQSMMDDLRAENSSLLKSVQLELAQQMARLQSQLLADLSAKLQQVIPNDQVKRQTIAEVSELVTRVLGSVQDIQTATIERHATLTLGRFEKSIAGTVQEYSLPEGPTPRRPLPRPSGPAPAGRRSDRALTGRLGLKADPGVRDS